MVSFILYKNARANFRASHRRLHTRLQIMLVYAICDLIHGMLY